MSARRLASLCGYALGSLARRGRRSLATLLGLTAAVALVAGVTLVSDALRAEAAEVRARAPDLVVQRLVGGRPSLVPLSLARAFEGLAGVRRATPRVWGYLFLPSISGNVTVVSRVPSLDAGAQGVVEGALPEPDARGRCAVGRELARALGVRVGDKLVLPDRTSTGASCVVAGVFVAPLALHSADLVVVPEADARALLGVPADAATDVAVELVAPDEAPVVSRAAAAMDPSLRVVDKALVERVHALVYGRRAGFVLGASVPALLVLLVLAIDRASGLGTSERRELAILKASGWSTRDVLAMKTWEALLLGTGASALGLLLAYGWAFWLDAPGLAPALAGWSTLYPSVALTPTLTLAQALLVTALTTLPFVALTVVPAYRAAALDPQSALRQ
ncbi:MAG: ABC transporter permease [Polyangiaceae bacterium]|nr:ABC transporter permease [Polyangiaceae bacterium]